MGPIPPPPPPPPDEQKEQVVSLLPFELSIPIMMQQFSTASVTWYQWNGESDSHKQVQQEVAQYLQHRLTLMLEANPWLGGRIKTRNGAAAIVYSTATSKQEADVILTVYKPGEIAVSMDTPYPKASALLQQTTVPLTYFWVWGWNVPFFRVALVPDCQNPNRFAIVTSLAHCVGDGHTYYMLHNMLANNAPIVKLHIQRKHYMHDVMTNAMGGPAFMGVYSHPTIGLIFRLARSVLMGFLFGPRAVVKVCHVNKEWIQTQKAMAMEQNNATKDNNDNNDTPPPPFVSSNDVLASQFMNTTQCDQALMTINFRGKIKDCHEHDAGNYYNFNPLRPPDFSTPVMIRKVVDQLKLQGQRYPTTRPMTSFEHIFNQSWRTPIAILTNLADFNKPLPLLSEAKQLIHMPLIPTHSWRMPPILFSICYVFKPTKECNSLAVLISATPKAMKELEETGMMGPEILPSSSVDSAVDSNSSSSNPTKEKTV